MGVHIPQGKTNKSFTKRFRVTRKGKVLARKAGQNHFNAKQSRSKQLNAKNLVAFNMKAKVIRKFVPQVKY